MIQEQIAYNIKFFREKHGWTQEMLAEKILSSRSTIAKWENKVTLPDIESLIKLSDVFNVTLDSLVGTESGQHNLLKDFKRIYSSKIQPFDEEIIELAGYLMRFPKFKEQIYRLKKLPIQKQLSIHHLIGEIISQYEKL